MLRKLKKSHFRFSRKNINVQRYLVLLYGVRNVCERFYLCSAQRGKFLLNITCTETLARGKLLVHPGYAKFYALTLRY